VETAADALEYITVGAAAVQVGTASFSDPKASEAIVEGLQGAFFDAKVLTVSELGGKFKTENG
jgi:dihydroorotate dehydrogenase (NAD+) catalytic subunit